MVLALLVLAGCGESGGVGAAGDAAGTDGSGGSTAAASSADAEAADVELVDDGEGLAVAQGSALVTIGAEEYEIDGNTACVTGGFVSVTFATSADEITINDTGDVVLIRMQFQGEDWADVGSPEPPVVIEVDGHRVVSWSGTMASLPDGVSEMVSLEIGC